MMQLYNDNLRQFLKLFPAKIKASNFKKAGYEEMQSFTALKNALYITYNSEELISVLAVDIDTHKDGAVWLDAELPEPTWTVWTDRGVQFAWALNKHILANVPEHYKYAEDTLLKIAFALDADRNAIGLHRVFRNPFTNTSRITESRVDLKDFKHLELPPKSFKKSAEPETEYDFFSMVEGDGRNEALFDRLRFLAYAEAKNGTYTEFFIAEQAHTLNNTFKEPMQEKEVEDTIKSIDKFINKKYGSNYMQNKTKEERREIAKKNGKKGGAVTAKKRKAEAWGKILATINQMQSFEIKITVSEVARRAKSKRDTVRALLLENGWEEVSRKEGWKTKKKIISLLKKGEDLQNFFAKLK